MTLDLTSLAFARTSARVRGCSCAQPTRGGLIRRFPATAPERREVQGVAARRDAHLNNRKEGNDMNADNPSIYDYRDNEIEAAQRIRRERTRAIVGGIIAAPFAVAALVAWAIILACM